MTRVETKEVQRPSCGKTSEFRLYSSVNAQLNPELVEKLLDGSLFVFVCPECKSVTPVFYPCLHNEMRKGVMVQLVSEGGEREVIDFLDSAAGDPKFACFAGTSVHRIVFTQNELREKALLLRDDFDDDVMEILKVFAKQMAKEQGVVEGNERLLYCAVGEDVINVAIVSDEDGTQGVLDVPMGMYKEIARVFGESYGRAVLTNHPIYCQTTLRRDRSLFVYLLVRNP